MSLFCRVAGAVVALPGTVRQRAGVLAGVVGGADCRRSCRSCVGLGGGPAIRVALVAATSLAVGVSAASAGIKHGYLCQITGTNPGSASECSPGGSAVTGGLRVPWGVTVSNGNVWVADPGNAAVDEFSSAGAAVSQNTGSGNFSGSFVRSIAVDDSTQFSYVADSGRDVVDVFDNTGAFVTQWDGSTTPSRTFGNDFVYAAVDNSTGPSAGDLYVTGSNDEVINKLSGGTTAGSQPTPVAFSGSASYISGSQIKGTPSGSFGDLEGIAVDSSGNIYAVDQGDEVVDEFSQTGTFVRQFTGTDVPGGSFGSVVAVGVDNANGNVYVVDAADDAVDEFTSSGEFLTQLTGAATPAGSFNTPNGVAVDASGDVYVADGGNHVIDKFGPEVTTTGPPQVDAESATGASDSGVRLQARINPEGADTSYQFEYGPTTAYGTDVPVPGTDIGSGQLDQAVSQQLTGLAPDAAYHYRVVATSSLGTVDGPDRTFATNPAPGVTVGQSCPNAQFRVGYSQDLADCRAYEQVSPVDKNGGDVAVPNKLNFGIQASVNGNAMAYVSGTPFPGSLATSAGSYYVASRQADGWVTQSLLPPQATNTSISAAGPAIAGFSSDLSFAALDDGIGQGRGFSFGQDDPALVAGEPPGIANLFIGDNATGSYQLADVTPAGDVPGDSLFAGASSDFSHVVFESWGKLTADAPTAPANNLINLYDWFDGTIRLANLIPPAGDTECGGAGPACVPSPNGGDAGGGQFAGNGAINAVSADGSKIDFFDNGIGSGKGQLYVRENGTTTLAVSASQKTNGSGPGGTDPNGPVQPFYETASADGAHVFFTSCEQLTNDSTAVAPRPGSCGTIGPEGLGGGDLYEYDTTTGRLTDLSVDPSPTTDASCSPANGTFCGANVQGVLGVSSDGSYVYFVADGVLAPSASPGTCDQNRTPRETCNLYVSHNGAITYIGALDVGDRNDWTYSSGQTARVSADGSYLTFMSTRSVTGYDNTDASTGKPDAEVFLYNATSNRLVCASCNPTGARPLGPSSISAVERNSSLVGGYLPRNLSDGGRLFFDSSDALVPAATNGVQDVYEWEPEGVGSCQSATANGGCLYLISSGSSPDNSTFLDATPSGDDVFFATSQQLVSQDTDQNVDLYDARVAGGIAAQNPGPPQPPCTGGTCTGASTSAPAVPTAASIAFSGPGDQAATSASKPKLAKVRVTHKAVKGSRFTLSVKVPARGRITISGADVTKATKAVAKAGTYRLTLKLTTKAKRALKKKRRLRLAVRAAYKPSSGSSSAVSVSIEMKA